MTTYVMPDPEELRKLWNDHIEDCSPGEVHTLSELMGRDEEGVNAIYHWLQRSLAEMVLTIPFTTEELLKLIRFMISGIGYFIDGRCMCCGEAVYEDMERMHRERFIEETATAGGTLRGEGDQPVPGEGDCDHS